MCFIRRKQENFGIHGIHGMHGVQAVVSCDAGPSLGGGQSTYVQYSREHTTRAEVRTRSGTRTRTRTRTGIRIITGSGEKDSKDRREEVGRK